MRDDGRRARIMAAVTVRDAAAGVSELMERLCRFAVDEMALSGCALVLMSTADSATVLAGAGRHARSVTGLQMELGEGPCLQAYASGVPVLLPDLAAENANRWPAFAAAALAIGVHAEFSLPLSVGPRGIGTLDLCRDKPGMLSEEHLADALVAADIARDAVLYQPYAQGGPDHAGAAGDDRRGPGRDPSGDRDDRRAAGRDHVQRARPAAGRGLRERAFDLRHCAGCR